MPDFKPMDDDTLTSVVRSALTDAENYNDDLGEERERDTRYFEGQGYGSELPDKQGRSKVITREVRDTVRQVMPALMRIVFGARNAVEFRGRRADSVQAAKQATDYVNFVIRNDNDAYNEFQSAFEDALVRKNGTFKVWWDDSEEVEPFELTGLAEPQLMLLEGDEEVDLLEVTPEFEDGEDLMNLEASTWTVRGNRIIERGRCRFEAVPPEEMLINREARSIKRANLVAHMRNVTIGYLLELGYDESDLEDLEGDAESDDSGEREARNPHYDNGTEDSVDPSMREVAYAEVYMRVDADGDGRAELRRLCVAGSGYKILENEPVSRIPFVTFSPDPAAHSAIGNSLASLVTDLQLQNSNILRNVLDSLANSIHPDVEVVEGNVNIDDLMNPEVGRIIRTRAPGMMREVKSSFAGADALPVLQYLEGRLESRTGLSRASQGLDADSLQSTTAVAIEAMTKGAAAQLELIARNVVERGLRPLYELMLRTLSENQDRARVVRLRGDYVEVDPRPWAVEMDVEVTEPLGAGAEQQRVATLMQILEKQEMIMQTAGVDNPLATPVEYRNTLAELLQLSGFADPSQFFKDPSREPPKESAPPAPDPNMLIAQAEVERNQAKTQLEAQQFALDQWKAQREDDRQRDKIMADARIAAMKIEAESGVKIETAQIDAAISHLGHVSQLDSNERTAAMQEALRAQSVGKDRQI